jgi:serine O-acetyltransferase
MNPFSKRLLASIRAYQYHRARGGLPHKLMRRLARLRHMFWSIITQSDIALEARLGSGLMLPHPNGVVIHEDARIGDDCMIMQQVTVGMIGDGDVPTIGNAVYVGAGAKIIGKLLIGDRARIGANAVVLTDVPANCTAVGIPARVIQQFPAGRIPGALDDDP